MEGGLCAMMATLLWLKDNWRLAIFLAIVVALGVQTYRLQGVKAERDMLALEKSERATRDAMRAAQNVRNKERTNEEYAAARRRAQLAGVQSKPAERISTVRIETGSGAEPTTCYGRRELDEELAGFAERTASRLDKVIAELLRRNAERLGGVAKPGEEVAAAYRACRAYVLNLTENAPGKAEHDRAVGGVAVVPALPVPRSTSEGESTPLHTSYELSATALSPEHRARSIP
jgi:hypothetical protein